MINFMLEAVKNRLNKVLIAKYLNNSGTAEVVDGGQPTVPYQGIVFLGVHGGSINNLGSDGGFYLRERYNFSITVSIKTSRTQRLKLGDVEFDKAENGIYRVTDLVKGAFQGYLDLATDANNLMQVFDPTAQTFVWGVQPVYAGSEEPVIRTASWFGASASDQGGMMGISMKSQFAGLEMIRSIDNITLN